MLLVAALTCATPALAQEPGTVEVRGEVGALAVAFPGLDVSEFRSRVRLEVTADPSPWLRLKLEGTVDALLADRGGRVDDAVMRAREAWVELRGSGAEFRVGYGRMVWGRLDEIMPSDVLNPVETSRYFLEGRSEARLPVAFARGRVFLTDETTVELLASLPGRRGRFDELDEVTSPFNLAGGALRREEPGASWDNVQTGGRVSTTLGRLDASVSAYRGTEAFGTVTLTPTGLVERYSRFTMFATDAEAVVGSWALRAEAAYFSDRVLPGPFGPRAGRAVDAGAGIDRSAGDYHVFASIVWHRDWTTDGPASHNTDLSVIGSIERRFSRDRFLVRVFGVANPVDDSGFVRSLAAWSVRDNVAVEASGGVFFGSAAGTDTLSRFRERDFVFTRLRWFF